MRTPTGRPPNPADFSDDVSQQGLERSTAEHHPHENEPTQTTRSPSPIWERADTEPRSGVAGDIDPSLSPYAPKHGRLRSAPEPDRSSAGGNTQPRDSAAPLQGEYPNGDLHARQASHRSELVGDHDVERLEASLRWLQRQDAAARLARETRPAPALAHHAAAPRYPGSERSFRRLPSLEPERVGFPPAMEHPSRLKWLAPILIASAGIAVPILYYFSTEGPGPEPRGEPPPQLASIKQASDTPLRIGREASEPIGHRDDDAATSVAPANSFRQANALPTEPSSTSAALKLPPKNPTGVGAPIASKPVRMLDPEEVAALVKRGEQLVATGDLVTARTAFRRAAEAGDAAAAIALGATFDPIVLGKLGVIGLGSDIDEARRWYQKAESMGSAEATRRLQILAKQ